MVTLTPDSLLSLSFLSLPPFPGSPSYINALFVLFCDPLTLEDSSGAW